MADAKKAETKNQHYVPQFYQRFFSADPDRKTIGAYAIKQGKYIPKAPIKNQSSGDYIYSDNQKIEDALGKMEDLASVVIKKIITDPKQVLTKEEWYTIYAYTFMQIGRTIDRANLLQETADKMAKSLLKSYAEAKKKIGDAAEVDFITDELLDAFSVNLQKPAMFSLGQHAAMINTCIDLNMKVLINKTKIPFITSDNPACMYSMFLERVGDPIYALGSKGLMFYLSLSKDLALMFFDPMCYKLGDRKKSYVELTQVQDVSNLNRLSACYANEMLYCLDGSISSNDLEKLAADHDKYRPQERIATIDGTQYGEDEIAGTLTNSIYCKLNLTFVKELPAIKAMNATNYNPIKDRLRPIAYMRDELIKKIHTK